MQGHFHWDERNAIELEASGYRMILFNHQATLLQIFPPQVENPGEVYNT